VTVSGSSDTIPRNMTLPRPTFRAAASMPQFAE
jgi:hypothetical protein